MKICVVCKHGVFRSPVLACVLRKFGVNAFARGLSEKYAGMSPLEVDVIRESTSKFGVDLSDYKVETLKGEDIASSDLILSFESSLKDKIIKRFPKAKGKVFTIGELLGENMEIPDLKGKSLEEFEEFIRNCFEIAKRIISRI
ncbi:MAG TPA: hypothetical protein ENF51_01425 [Candidatus Aenigmarchaeota archaeon]|nr:hypothetical protein [Candidatus Aenigmarchaeota archaeon]